MKRLLLFSSMIFLGGVLSAQENGDPTNRKGETMISASAGLSLASLFLQGVLEFDSDVDASSTPVFNLTGEYRVFQELGVGLGLGVSATIQDIYADVKDHTYMNDIGAMVKEDFELDVYRWQIAFVPRVYFGEFEDVDLYSGLRLGMETLSVSTTSNDPNVYSELDLGPSLSLAVTLIGFRYYVVDTFGFNVDLNLGSPYISSFGIQLRF